ncbi:MAG: hypothetical protein S4CHLAM102_02070 [Chlamydiia bacterium]|nr:hypothetical protein [Chlamydiia bacterium]
MSVGSLQRALVAEYEQPQSEIQQVCAVGEEGALVRLAEEVKLYSVTEGLKWSVPIVKDSVLSMAIHDQKQLVVGRTAGSIGLCSLESGQVETPIGHRYQMQCFLPIGQKQLLSGPGARREGQFGKWDYSIKAWNLSRKAVYSSLEGHTAQVNKLVCLDHPRIASSSVDGTVRIWNHLESSQLHSLQAHLASITGIGFFNGNRQLATASTDQSMLLWDVERDARLGAFKAESAHTAPINDLAVKEHRILTGADEPTLKLWDSRTVSQITKLEFEAGAQIPSAQYLGAHHILAAIQAPSPAPDRFVILDDRRLT